MKPKAIKAPANEADAYKAKLTTLVPRARTDEKAAAEFWDLAEANGTADDFVRGSDMAYQAERSLIGAYGGGKDVLLRQASERRLALMRRELAGDNPTPLEELLAQRIALCWHHVHLCEAIVAQNAGSMSLAQASYQGKALDSAHKRYLGAIKALATVRKLQLPSVQVNIGEKQVNIAQMNGTPQT